MFHLVEYLELRFGVPVIIYFTLESAVWLVHGGDSSSPFHAASAGAVGSEVNRGCRPGASVPLYRGFCPELLGHHYTTAAAV